MALNQFLVPQFIEVEDKIIGPITIRQFTIMIIGVIVCVAWWRIFGLLGFAIATLFTLGPAAILAFARVNGRPVHYFMLNFIQTAQRPGLRMWNKEAYVHDVKEIEQGGVVEQAPIAKKQLLTGSKLDDLTLLLNTGGVYQSDDDQSDVNVD